ncbi:unnamed protein product [Choristocarpus tenellus]
MMTPDINPQGYHCGGGKNFFSSDHERRNDTWGLILVMKRLDFFFRVSKMVLGLGLGETNGVRECRRKSNWGLGRGFLHKPMGTGLRHLHSRGVRGLGQEGSHNPLNPGCCLSSGRIEWGHHNLHWHGREPLDEQPLWSDTRWRM